MLLVLDKPMTCCHCGEPLLADEAVRWLNDEEAQHVRQCPQWEPAGPISDGTLRCPRSHNNVPCQKLIPAGWHENQGHSGGHWFEPDEHAHARLSGRMHTDATAMLSLRPFDEHPADNCPDPKTCALRGA